MYSSPFDVPFSDGTHYTKPAGFHQSECAGSRCARRRKLAYVRAQAIVRAHASQLAGKNYMKQGQARKKYQGVVITAFGEFRTRFRPFRAEKSPVGGFPAGRSGVQALKTAGAFHFPEKTNSS